MLCLLIVVTYMKNLMQVGVVKSDGIRTGNFFVESFLQFRDYLVS